MAGTSAGRRKRSDDDERDNEPTLLTGQEGWYDKFDKYRLGENYQPKRQRTRLTWAMTTHSEQHTPSFDYLLNFDDGQPMSDEDDQGYQWAAKHLISSLQTETAWQPPIKSEILEYLLTAADFWKDLTEEQASNGAVATLKNAMQWGLMMLRDIRTSAEETSWERTSAVIPLSLENRGWRASQRCIKVFTTGSLSSLRVPITKIKCILATPSR
ncbi:hypothetical protein E8E11_010766 [Didymella keratinophila]|nr:hypothetical protein E8E11_010766 [Didymella keratinophila]